LCGGPATPAAGGRRAFGQNAILDQRAYRLGTPVGPDMAASPSPSPRPAMPPRRAEQRDTSQSGPKGGPPWVQRCLPPAADERGVARGRAGVRKTGVSGRGRSAVKLGWRKSSTGARRAGVSASRPRGSLGPIGSAGGVGEGIFGKGVSGGGRAAVKFRWRKSSTVATLGDTSAGRLGVSHRPIGLAGRAAV
jgi:hypothetical protein